MRKLLAILVMLVLLPSCGGGGAIPQSSAYIASSEDIEYGIDYRNYRQLESGTEVRDAFITFTNVGEVTLKFRWWSIWRYANGEVIGEEQQGSVLSLNPSQDITVPAGTSYPSDWHKEITRIELI